MIQKAFPHKIGMVFGVFDGLHQGHRYFLSEASRRCEKLIVVVTLPEIVYSLKNRLPQFAFAKRVSAIQNFNPKFQVVSGDETLGEWSVLKKYSPQIIFLGHDQQAIAGELSKLRIPFLFLGSHHPEKNKSSVIRK